MDGQPQIDGQYLNQKWVNDNVSKNWCQAIETRKGKCEESHNEYMLRLNGSFQLRSGSITLQLKRQQQSGSGTILPQVAFIYEEAILTKTTRLDLPGLSIQPTTFWNQIEMLLGRRVAEVEGARGYAIKWEGKEKGDRLKKHPLISQWIREKQLKAVIVGAERRTVTLKLNKVFLENELIEEILFFMEKVEETLL